MSDAERWRVDFPAEGGELIRVAATELAEGLTAMLGETIEAAPMAGLRPALLRVGRGRLAAPAPLATEDIPDGDGFALWRDAAADTSRGALILTGGNERAALAAACQLLEQLGARFPLVGAPHWPRINVERLDTVEPLRVVPAFTRRAMASDLMTWHYETPGRLQEHLQYDRQFARWMVARGLNAFSFIRHALDSRLKLDEMVPICSKRGIGSEYGGHVLQSLLPRELFATNPDFFPVTSHGERNARGNLCVANRRALQMVRDGAVGYLKQSPECTIMHIWGADVQKGAWCRCGECSHMSPQLQYMTVINAVAEALAGIGNGTPLAYLAYHDTIEPDPALRPLPNVHVEWAPRQRCYGHPINDPACEINPRYLEALKRYLELFDGRGQVFEYYADAILFGGIAVATPAIIAADLQAYRKLGVPGISCLTFGKHSAIAYPTNLEAFARGTRSPDFDPGTVMADTVAALHPACGPEMVDAYRAIARASLLILNSGGDVLQPEVNAGDPSAELSRRSRPVRLREAVQEIANAIEAADAIVDATFGDLTSFERSTWHYSREVVNGIYDYLIAADAPRSEQRSRVDGAIRRLATATEQLRAAAPAAADTWAAYDLEWASEMWLKRLKRHFGNFEKSRGVPGADK
jgi:Domain of unknown function (DUF4838)